MKYSVYLELTQNFSMIVEAEHPGEAQGKALNELNAAKPVKTVTQIDVQERG